MDDLCTKYCTIHMEDVSSKLTNEVTIVTEEDMTV